MKFKKYDSLENTYQEKLMQNIHTQGLADGDWVVTEKVHGANYSLYSDGSEVLAAKRTSFIGDEKFFNHVPVMQRYSEAVLTLSKDLGKTVRVVGELYGGNVQRKVYYKKEQDFVAFDIFVEDIPMDFNQFKKLCNKYNIPSVPLIGVYNTLKEALEVNNTFETWLSDNKDAENVCEGVVIRPSVNKFFRSGSRLVLKNKNDKFNEKKKVKKVKPKTQTSDMSEGAEILTQELKQYITSNRLSNVVSKLGEVTWKDFGKLQGLMIQDLVEDYNNEFEVSIKDAHKEDWKGIQKTLIFEVAPIVREYLEKNC